MTNLNIILNDFFNKNPDIRGGFVKDLINRRALAKYIIKKEKISYNLDAVITALRRFEIKEEEKDDLDIIKDIKITTKEGISIVCLEKNQDVLEKINKVISLVNYSKNETFKIVEGNLSVKLFVDSFKVDKIKEIFNKKDIIKIINNAAELNLMFPDKAIKTKGIVSYITSHLKINNINITEILSCTPELVIYVDESELINAYKTIKQLKDDFE